MLYTHIAYFQYWRGYTHIFINFQKWNTKKRHDNKFITFLIQLSYDNDDFDRNKEDFVFYIYFFFGLKNLNFIFIRPGILLCYYVRHELQVGQHFVQICGGQFGNIRC